MKHRQEERRVEAKERQAAYDALSIDEKIARAKARGGSRKELARLKKLKGGKK